jgi:hypothetical protein
VIAEEVTVRDPPVAVMVLEPAVFKVTEKVPTPEVRVADAGSVALESEEVMETALAKEVAVLPYASSAVTVALKEVPAVVLVEMDLKARELAAAGSTKTLRASLVRIPSVAVRVTVREEPDATVPLEAVTMLVAVE